MTSKRVTGSRSSLPRSIRSGTTTGSNSLLESEPPAESFEAAEGIFGIDTRMAGRGRVTAAYLVDATEPALVEAGPGSSAHNVVAGLGSIGVGPGSLAHIVLTHIHLDHAGGAGELASRFPEARIWVHERGARHLADPSRLVRSAARVYGGEAELQRLFGAVRPVEAGRLNSLDGGESLDLGGRRLTILYTPGHASHHIAVADERTGAIFSGDAIGVHLPEAGPLRPSAPPPEFDPDIAVDSIRRIGARARGALLLSHFGPEADVENLCEVAVETLRTWSESVRNAVEAGLDDEKLEAKLRSDTSADVAGLSVSAVDRLETVGSYRLNAMGLARYWRSRET